MPIYEYKCLGCASHVEKMQKVSDNPLVTCEKCGGKLEKQWSLSGFQFKGAGWYVTDYANKSVATVEKNEKSDKTEKSETAEKPAVAEKNSAAESTAKTEAASNKSNETRTDSKKETVKQKE